MIDHFTFEQCKRNKEILQLKILNLEHAIRETELIISESKMDNASLIFLRRKIADSNQELESLYFLRRQFEKDET